LLVIYVDADACPVKDEVYKVAERYQLQVYLVANQPMRIPQDSRIHMVVASADFDAADDWIVEHLTPGDLVITGDILLAQRGVGAQARVIGPKGLEFTEDSIGSAVSDRELMQNLRHMGEQRGPAPMDKKDRSRFLAKLDEVIQSVKRDPRYQKGRD